MVLKNFAEKPHHSPLLLLTALPLQNLLEMPQLEDVPAAHFSKLYLFKLFLHQLLERLSSARILTEYVDHRIFLQKLPKNIRFEAVNAGPHFLHVPLEVHLSEIALK